MYEIHRDDIQKYVEMTGSTFLACNFIAQCAKQLRKHYHYILSESEALEWVIKQRPPDSLYDISSRLENSKFKHDYEMYDRLKYIEDDEVVTAVKASLNASTYYHPIYKYGSIQDTYKKARVRILTKMILDDMQYIKNVYDAFKY